MEKEESKVKKDGSRDEVEWKPKARQYFSNMEMDARVTSEDIALQPCLGSNTTPKVEWNWLTEQKKILIFFLLPNLILVHGQFSRFAGSKCFTTDPIRL